jgi:outer membrane protein TolC
MREEIAMTQSCEDKYMPSPQKLPRVRTLAGIVAIVLLAGCASSAIDQNFTSAQTLVRDRLNSEVKWLTSDDARRQAKEAVDELLREPLSMDGAVRIALAYSPALQALLFEGAATSASATQAARLPNPVFTFERLVRREGGVTDLDIGRALGISLLDLFLIPSKLRLAGYQQEQVRLKLSGDVVQAVTEARQTWVRAVAAEQSLRYFEQVKASADASAELARRMQAVGNFNRLQRAREQAFAADAVAQLARARQTALGAREALVRALGLDGIQASALKLPERLPDLPAQPKGEEIVLQAAIDQRLDVQMAKAALEYTARSQGMTRVTSVVNGFHIAGVRNSETGAPTQKGFELEFPLPIFDFGDAQRAGSQSRYMAQLNRTAQLAVDASSQVREVYSGYRTAYDLARHYRDEIVPLRKTISDENLLRYNGMLIGVFELLADAREQIGSVVQALEAQRDFWLTDAALQAALIGKPVAGLALEASAAPVGAGGSAGH